MRHRVATTSLSRQTKHRKALLVNLVQELLRNGKIITTAAKAKHVKRWADKVISKAQTDSIATRRQLHKWFGSRQVVNTLVERIAPAMGKRNSGFTTHQALGVRRGDNTQMVSVSLVQELPTTGFKSQNTTKVTKKVAKTTKKSSAKPAKKSSVAPVRAPKKETAASQTNVTKTTRTKKPSASK